MGKIEKKISPSPLLKRLGKEKGAVAKFGRKINASDQVLSNWKRRGIPARELPRIAAGLGISVDQYLLESGHTTNVAREPGAQYTFEAAALLEDFNALPAWLKEHIARKAADLRRFADSLPDYVRDGMKAPPKDPQEYAQWERNIEADIIAQRTRSANEKERK